MNGRYRSSSHDAPRRTEPVLGNVDQVDPGADRRGPERAAPVEPNPRPPFRADSRREVPVHRRRRWPWAAVVVIVLVAAGGWAWTHQAMLRGLLPQTQLNTLLTRAGAAYSAGQLAGGPDSARDLYEAVRVLDPDNEQALAGLQKVGNAELARARTALQQRDYADARMALEQARSLLGGGTDVAAVDRDLAKAILHNANVEVLIEQARAALANGRIDGSDGAAALFGKVLAGDPHNAVARNGIDQVGDVLATRIQTQLTANDRAGAKKTLADLAGMLPRYAQLPNLRALIAAADRTADVQRDQYLANGETYLRAGKVAGSGDDNAEAQYKAALAADPGNAKAEAGLGQVAQALIMQANAAIDAGHRDAATGLLDAAEGLAPKSADLAAARSRLAAGGRQVAGSAPPAVLTAAQAAKVAQLVARAGAAARKGDIMLPPGNSAYDLYRAALGIDGNDAAAQAGLRALPQVTRAEFDRALRDGNLEHAHDMLATLDQIDPGDPTAATMRHRLGSAWLDRADHDATLGRLAPARTALEEAQRLVPSDPRISEVDARIRRNN